MNVLTIVSPGLKVLFERVGKPEVINRPEVLRLSGTAAVIACNHIGWVDSLWVAYAVYPRQLRYMSKQELFNSRVAKWILEQGGSFAVDREAPSRDSIKTALDPNGVLAPGRYEQSAKVRAGQTVQPVGVT